MRKRITLLLIAAFVLCGTWFAFAETGFNSVSATQTSSTLTFASPRVYVTLCNYGANEVYYRIFEAPDTPAASTTSYAQLVAGTATAPVCISWPKSATYYKAVSIICATGETATVHVLSAR